MLALLIFYLLPFPSSAKLADCALRNPPARMIEDLRSPSEHTFSKEDNLNGGPPADIRVATQFPNKLRLNASHVGYPLTAVGLVTSSISKGCHGQLVNFCTIAVSAHCLRDKDGQLATDLKIKTADGKERSLLNPEAPNYMTKVSQANGKISELYHPTEDIAFVQVAKQDNEELWPGQSLGRFQVPDFGPDDLGKNGERYCNYGNIHNRNGLTDKPTVDADITFFGREETPGSPDNYVRHNMNGGEGGSGSAFFKCMPEKQGNKVTSFKLPTERDEKNREQPIAVMIGIFSNVSEEAHSLGRTLTEDEAKQSKYQSNAVLNNAYIGRLKEYVRKNPCRNLPVHMASAK